MKQSSHGFTIIELVIILVLIALIATIGLVSWNGVTVSSRNKSRETDTKIWMGNFDVYRARFVVNPAMPAGDGASNGRAYCLGSFTKTLNKCGQYNSSSSTAALNASASATMLSEMGKVGKTPDNNGAPFQNLLAGPIVYTSQSSSGGTTTVAAQFINFFENNCPSGFTNINGSLPSPISGVLSGLPAGTNVYACAISKTFSYTP